MAPATFIPGKLISAMSLWICLSLEISQWTFASTFLMNTRNVVGSSLVQVFLVVRMAMIISKLLMCQLLSQKQQNVLINRCK